ncbi:hypothetical protein J6O48_04045 [bacterium]|nr:hypothetical protein [bacterium]
MEKESNLAELTKYASDKLLESVYLIDALEELTDIDPKCGTIISIIKNNINFAFDNIEQCRNKIYILD